MNGGVKPAEGVGVELEPGGVRGELGRLLHRLVVRERRAAHVRRQPAQPPRHRHHPGPAETNLCHG